MTYKKFMTPNQIRKERLRRKAKRLGYNTAPSPLDLRTKASPEHIWSTDEINQATNLKAEAALKRKSESFKRGLDRLHGREK